MKRLTGRAADGTAYLYNMGGTNEAIDRLAAYEDTGLEPDEIMADMPDITAIESELDKYKCAEAEGRLLVLPCKVGDKVWRIGTGIHRDRIVYPTVVKNIVKIALWMQCEDFGKTVFLSREQAEAALRKENGNE